MAHVDYVEWATFILQEMPVRGRALELAGGTGELATQMASHFEGYILSDLNVSMVKENHQEGLVLDMRQIPFKECFDSVFCCYDSFNYLLTEADIRQHLLEVQSVLKTGGIYHFDTTSEYASYTYFQDYVDYEELEGVDIVRRAWLEDDLQYNEFIFYQDDLMGSYTKIRELHTQKLWPHSFLLNILKEQGWKIIKCLGDYKREDIHAEHLRRHYFIQKL
jgi:SAM-dependent methyltransferase